MKRCLPLPILLLVSLLGACTLLPEGETLTLYQLPGTAPAVITDTPLIPARSWLLRVNTPSSAPLLDSSRILVRPQGNRLSAYQGVRWSDHPARLLRDRLIAAFAEDGRVIALSDEEQRLSAALELDGDLLAFHSEYQGDRPTVHLLLQARLRDGTRLIASRRFDVRQAPADSSIESVVTAFGQAAEQLSRQLLEWTLAHASRPSSRTPERQAQKSG